MSLALRTRLPRRSDGSAPGAEVDAIDIGVGDFADAEFVSEIRGSSDGAAMFVKCFEPALGAREESKRRHDGERRAEEEKSEPRADEAHVVIERQPADADIVGS